MSKIPHIGKRGDWTFKRIGKTNYVEIYPSKEYTNRAITMTGSDVSKQIDIPWTHRICNLKLFHMDSSYDPSTDALAVTLERPQSHIPALSKMHDQPLRKYDVTSSKKIFAFADFEVAPIPPSIWKLTLNSTNTDLVVPVLTIQVLGGV